MKFILLFIIWLISFKSYGQNIFDRVEQKLNIIEIQPIDSIKDFEKMQEYYLHLNLDSQEFLLRKKWIYDNPRKIIRKQDKLIFVIDSIKIIVKDYSVIKSIQNELPPNFPPPFRRRYKY